MWVWLPSPFPHVRARPLLLLHSHATQALHTELAALRAQVDQLAPALAVATAASAEARAVSSRLDAVQQQQAAGGGVVLEQQVVQLQAQVRAACCAGEVAVCYRV